MGLCKCPKRKVTNQFCYEHRVNVCENCMVTNHPKCIVLSYLKWLQDGDYNPICELCTKKLSDEECIRLICYHVFHWHCLDHYERQLPPTTAPAGYTCPSCANPLFPPANLVSPVADILFEKLRSVNWARAGLGMPLLPASEEIKPEEKFTNVSNNDSYFENRTNDTILQIGETNNEPYRKNDMFVKQFPDNVPRRLTHTTETKKLTNNSIDRDENKYERRTMTERFSKWHVCARNSRYFQFYFRHKYRRYFVMGTFLFIAFFLFMIILDKLSYEVPYDENPFVNEAFVHQEGNRES